MFYKKRKGLAVSEREIERNYKTDWMKYDNGIISYGVLKEHVGYYADQMEKYDEDRAAEMRKSVGLN